MAISAYANAEALAREITGGAEVLKPLQKRIAAELLRERAIGYEEGSEDTRAALSDFLVMEIDGSTGKAAVYEGQALQMEGS